MNKQRKSFSRKRSDTKIGTIERKYGRDFGVRSDTRLGTYLRKKGYSSLSELLRNE
jgi:hypothetical protein